MKTASSNASHASVHATPKQTQPAPSEPPVRRPTGEIVLLGTSHMSAESKRLVEQAITSADVIAIELDHGRAQALLSGERASFRDLQAALGLRAALLATLLRGMQERIAKSIGVVPGLEMKAALVAAQAANKPIALIDRDVRTTLKRLSASVGWREIRTMLSDMFRRRKQRVSLHPSDELVLALLAEMKERYPRVYTAMVSERDAYMTRQLLALRQKFPESSILAVVGKGHVPGMVVHLEASSAAYRVYE